MARSKKLSGFQSTLPRGERLGDRTGGHLHRDFNPRSREGSDIHSRIHIKSNSNFNPRSREGSDQKYTKSIFYCSNFNPRSREGSDDSQQLSLQASWQISIHAPARGATIYPFGLKDRLMISIHAPARGATQTAEKIWRQCLIFQSTLPRGERPREGEKPVVMHRRFQSTLPRGERRIHVHR